MSYLPRHVYHPTPSDYLRRQGTVVEGSYFFAEGQLTFADEEKTSLDCTFEVAQMQDGKCWAVGYIEFGEEYDWQQDFPKIYQLIDNHRFESFKGIENLLGRQVIGYFNSKINRVFSPEHKSGFRILILLSKYEVTYGDSLSFDHYHFYVTNLPLDSGYNPAKRYDKEHDDKERLPQNIPIYLNDNELACIYWKEHIAIISHASEPISRLELKASAIPHRWSAENIVDWICCLFGIGLGIDVQWTFWQSRKFSNVIPPSKQVWRTRTIQTQRFTPFIVDDHQASMILNQAYDIGLEEKSGEWLFYFVESVLQNIVKQNFDETSDYYDLILKYIHYMSISAVLQVQSTILVTMSERIYKLWVNDDKENRKYIMADTENISRELIRNALLEIDPKLHAADTVDKANLQQKFKGMRDKILSNLGQPSLLEKLQSFFEFHNYPEEHWIKNNIKLLIASRNALAHDHVFASYRSRFKLDATDLDEISNVEMMIPLMLVTILGYEGRFYNSYEANRGNGRDNIWSWTLNGLDIDPNRENRG